MTTRQAESNLAKPQTWNGLIKRKTEGGKPFAVLTAYDFATARTLDEAGIEVILVGDSLAMTALGYPDTLSVTLEEMLHHTKAVSRAVKQALIVADAPFMSYSISVEHALGGLSRFIKEGGAHAVKLEGAASLTLEIVQRLTESGIPVWGHLGLTPQSICRLGTYHLQAKTVDKALQLIHEARQLEKAGAVGLVLELVPQEVAQAVRQTLGIPVIGIGSGPHCDAQVLVTDDILGRFKEFTPRFARQYAQINTVLQKAARQFQADIAEKHFPSQERGEVFSLKSDEADRFWQTFQT